MERVGGLLVKTAGHSGACRRAVAGAVCSTRNLKMLTQ